MLIQLTSHSHVGHVKLPLLCQDTVTSGTITAPVGIGAPSVDGCFADFHVSYLIWLLFTSSTVSRVLSSDRRRIEYYLVSSPFGPIAPRP
jgi:hypothetical protein